jgi:hypothetical protein
MNERTIIFLIDFHLQVIEMWFVIYYLFNAASYLSNIFLLPGTIIFILKSFRDNPGSFSFASSG